MVEYHSTSIIDFFVESLGGGQVIFFGSMYDVPYRTLVLVPTCACAGVQCEFKSVSEKHFERNLIKFDSI